MYPTLFGDNWTSQTLYKVIALVMLSSAESPPTPLCGIWGCGRRPYDGINIAFLYLLSGRRWGHLRSMKRRKDKKQRWILCHKSKKKKFASDTSKRSAADWAKALAVLCGPDRGAFRRDAVSSVRLGKDTFTVLIQGMAVTFHTTVA